MHTGFCKEIRGGEKVKLKFDPSELGEREIYRIGGKYYFRCKNCGKLKYIRPADLKREGNRGYFCSRKCWGEYFGRVETTCAYCGKKITVPKNKFLKWKTHYCSTECYNKARSGLKVPVNLEPSSELAYILGVCLGDGCVGSYVKGKEKKCSYEIKLAVEHREFAESFKEALESIGLHPSMFLRTSVRPNEKPLWWVEAHSKVFVEWYKDITSDFSKLEEFLRKCPRGFEEFVRGFYESEGYYYEGLNKYGGRQRNLHIYNTNKGLVDLVVKILKELGFRVTVRVDRREHLGRKDKYCIRVLAKDIVKFFALIKPVIKNPYKKRK